jgi:hypothetical protein
VTAIRLSSNDIGAEGASALAEAFKAKTHLTNIDLRDNKICAVGASALVEALKVNTSVTNINLDRNRIGSSSIAHIDELLARNKRFCRYFLFDARQMLLSLMCADECGVVWPYLLGSDEIKDGMLAPGNVEALRVELQSVVAERRRRSQVTPGAKRRRLK